MLKDSVDEIYKQIVLQNSRNDLDSIPHSDEFRKRMISQFGFDEKTITMAVSLLKDSHHIFVMEITREDDLRKISRIEGYVECSIVTIRRLLDFFSTSLTTLYERQFHKRLMQNQIIREILPKINLYNNTTMGSLVNKTMMLNEYELQVTKNYPQYTESWKTGKLNSLIQGHEKKLAAEAQQQEVWSAGEGRQRRAVDSPQYADFVSTVNDSPTWRIIEQFGIHFFIRVNLRKYNFLYLKKLIDTKVITRKPDVYLLNDMLQKVKSNFDRDAMLENYRADIDILDAAIAKFLDSAPD